MNTYCANGRIKLPRNASSILNSRRICFSDVNSELGEPGETGAGEDDDSLESELEGMYTGSNASGRDGDATSCESIPRTCTDDDEAEGVAGL